MTVVLGKGAAPTSRDVPWVALMDLLCSVLTITVVAISGGSPMGLEVGLQASAGRGFSPPTCIVLFCLGGGRRHHHQNSGIAHDP